jgi:gliding motility-associated lipoprotein GldH
MTKGINRYLIFSFLLIQSILFTSCDSRVVFSGSENMDNNTWNLMNPATFLVDVRDTINSNNVFFSIRTGSGYPFRNIWLFISTTSPDGRTIGDTVQYFLIDERGNRFGKGFGDIREVSLPYKSNVYFPVQGPYRFTIQHGMRAEDLEGVYDFGLRVEKIKK